MPRRGTAGRRLARAGAAHGVPAGRDPGRSAGLLLLVAAVALGVVALYRRAPERRRSRGPAPGARRARPRPRRRRAHRRLRWRPRAPCTSRASPPGATVTVDGQARGATPARRGRPALGRHEVKVELKGYAARTADVTLTRRGAARRAEARPRRARRPTTGAAEIVSTPVGRHRSSIDGARGRPDAARGPEAQGRARHQVEIDEGGLRALVGRRSPSQAGKRARVDAAARRPRSAHRRPAARRPRPWTRPTVYASSREVDARPGKISRASASYPAERAALQVRRVGLGARQLRGHRERARSPTCGSWSRAARPLDEAVLAAVAEVEVQPRASKQGAKVKVRVDLPPDLPGRLAA